MSNATNEEQIPATGALDNKPTDGSEDGVNNHVNATQQHSLVVGGFKRVLEQNREVVDNSIASSDLLHKLGRGAEEHASEMLSLAVGEERGVWSLSTLVTGSGDTLHNDGLLELGLGVVLWEIVECCDDSKTLFVTVTGQEPTRRLWQEVCADAENKTEDDLESDGETPGEIINGALGRSVVDPVGDQSPEGDDATLDTD